MPRTTTLFLAVACLAACGESERMGERFAGDRVTRTLPPAGATPHTTRGGTVVWVPTPLEPHRALVREALAEVDAAAPPPGWEIHIREPVFFVAESIIGPTWARGVTYHDTRTIAVGWRMRPYESRPLLPALVWEVSLAWLPEREAFRRDFDAIHGSTE